MVGQLADGQATLGRPVDRHPLMSASRLASEKARGRHGLDVEAGVFAPKCRKRAERGAEAVGRADPDIAADRDIRKLVSARAASPFSIRSAVARKGLACRLIRAQPLVRQFSISLMPRLASRFAILRVDRRMIQSELAGGPEHLSTAGNGEEDPGCPSRS